MDEKIILKPDWDYQPKIGIYSGHHTTRESEHRILLDFIARRNEGSMLVCGQRGAGKTSSVFKAANDAVAQNRKIKPVLIKATSINLDEDDPKRGILRDLIRSLYTRVRDDPDVARELKAKTSELYDKAMASEAKHEDRSTNTSVRERTSYIHANLIPASLLIAVGTLSFLGAISENSWILSGVAMAGGWLLFGHLIVRKKSSVDVASDYYRYDYDFSTMQYEFELLLERFAKKGFKILFIIDELDKVDNPIDKILNLKMLINQGNALFIFIAAPNVLADVDDKAKPNSTLFSQTLYLKRPSFDEMRRFITGITLNGNKLLEDKDYRNFQDFLCYESKTGFFDLYKVIRDNMIETDPKGPVLNSSLDAGQITKFNLQKSIEWVYERKKYGSPSLWEENDKMLEAMYDICTAFENDSKLTDFSIDDQTFKFSKDNIKFEDKQYSAAADLVAFLTSQGYLHEVAQNNYRIVGHLSEFNEVSGGIFVEEQRIFKEAYENVLKLAIHMANIHNRYIENLGEIFSSDSIDSKWDSFSARIHDYLNMETFKEHRKIHTDLVRTDPEVYSSEKLQRMTSDLQNGYIVLKRRFTTLIAKILAKKIDGLKLKNIAKHTDQDILSNFRIPNTNLYHSVLHFTNSPRNHKLQYVIITESVPKDICVKLLKPTDQNILFIPLADSDDSSTYDNMPSVFSPDMLQQSLDELYTLDESSKKSLLMPLSIPIQSGALDPILRLL